MQARRGPDWLGGTTRSEVVVLQRKVRIRCKHISTADADERASGMLMHAVADVLVHPAKEWT